MKIWNDRINLLLCLVIVSNIIYFFLGFFYQHDFSNGGKIDFKHIFNNFLLFKETSIFNIDWFKYESSSLPLFYIITKIILPFKTESSLKLFTFIISLFCFFMFYFSLKQKFEEKKFNLHFMVISSILLISSSFRTDAFFGLEENISFFILFLFIICLQHYQKNKKIYFKYLAILLSCLIFYSRQTYAFVPIISYVYFLDKNNIFSFKNFNLSLIFSIFLIPSIYFFLKWDSLVPPMAVNRILTVDFNKIAITFAMYLVFFLPFYLFRYKNYFLLIKKNKIVLFIFFLIYSLIFWDTKVDNFGGGPIAKIFLIFPNLKLFYLFLSFLGFLGYLNLIFKNINLFIFLNFYLLFYLLSDYVFFSYLDPLFLIMIIIYNKNFKINFNLDRHYSIFIYSYFLLLHISWYYYYQVNLEGIIR